MKKSDICILIFIIVCILSFSMLKYFTYKSIPFIESYARSKCNNLMSNLINESILNVVSHEEIIKIDKNDNNEVVNLSINNSLVNSMLYTINENIREKIYNLETSDTLMYYVPFNVILDSPLLLYLSPMIPFKVSFLGNMSSSSSTNVKSYGINSYLVEVVIDIDIEVALVYPFSSSDYTVSNKVLLESKIIQGSIPKYYGS